ncbi:Gfo/Idh/MocA family oxidoreductase [Arthrobacter sp. B2a2-09]|nr:Gfo/Idh/MocA family oxidoreductase [Arthrobacter sp. B2a2-09]
MVPDLQSCVGADVVVVQSRDAEKAAAFAAEFDIPASTGEIEAVLADGSVDAVYVATPIATHFAIAKRTLLAGKHVLVEKPIAMNAGQVTELFELAATEGRFLMEAMWMKFNPAFTRLREEIAAGRIGEPRAVRAAFGMPMPKDGRSKWDPARSGGALLDQGIYPVTLAHAILGEPSSLSASGTLRPDGLDVDEHFTLEFAGGGRAYGAASMAEFVEPTASVSGTSGWMVLPPFFWATTSLEIHADTSERMLSAPERIVYAREGNGYVPMLRAVTQGILAGNMEHPVHPASDTIAVFRTLDEIRKQLGPAARARRRR